MALRATAELLGNSSSMDICDTPSAAGLSQPTPVQGGGESHCAYCLSSMCTIWRERPAGADGAHVARRLRIIYPNFFAHRCVCALCRFADFLTSASLSRQRAQNPEWRRRIAGIVLEERQGEPGDASGVLHGASQRQSDTACPRINRDRLDKVRKRRSCSPHPPSRHTRRERARCNPKSHPSDPSRSRAGRPAEHWACTQECSARQLIREEVGASRD